MFSLSTSRRRWPPQRLRWRAGQAVAIRELQTAGIATTRRAKLATRDIRHFEGTGVGIINPWD